MFFLTFLSMLIKKKLSRLINNLPNLLLNIIYIFNCYLKSMISTPAGGEKLNLEELTPASSEISFNE
mgnify:CR=1 FL=1